MTEYNRKFKILSGKHFDKTWHYGISIRSSLQPFPNFILKSHIIFTRGDEVLSVPKQHAARRMIAKRWFNNQWRDLLLAAALCLSDDPQDSNPVISIRGDTNQAVESIAFQRYFKVQLDMSSHTSRV